MKTRLAVCASAILSVAAGSTSAVTVGYWRLDDGVAGATLTTAASQVNNATLQGTGTGGGTRVFNADVPGQFISDGLNGPIVGSNSTSLQTNGGFVDIPFSSALEPTSFTIEFFMKAGATANFPGIVTKSSTLAGRPTSWGIGKNSAEQEFYRVDTAALNNFTQAGGLQTGINGNLAGQFASPNLFSQDVAQLQDHKGRDVEVCSTMLSSKGCV